VYYFQRHRDAYKFTTPDMKIPMLIMTETDPCKLVSLGLNRRVHARTSIPGSAHPLHGFGSTEEEAVADLCQIIRDLYGGDKFVEADLETGKVISSVADQRKRLGWPDLTEEQKEAFFYSNLDAIFERKP
jgi:hypothetical protein